MSGDDHPMRGIRRGPRCATVQGMTHILITPLVVALLGTGAVAACSSSGKPAVCDSAAQLKASASNLKDVQLSVNGLDQLKSELSKVKGDLDQVLKDAQKQYSDQVNVIRLDVSTLQASYQAAKSDPSKAHLDQVGQNVTTLFIHVQDLGKAIKSSC